MAEQESACSDRVGPVLGVGAIADAVLAAIRQLNAAVLVLDRGAYRRVLVPQHCVVTRTAIEEHLGRAVHFPGDVERVMPAFKGHFTVSEERAVWVLPAAASGNQESR
jgi:hypothetical protein